MKNLICSALFFFTMSFNYGQSIETIDKEIRDTKTLIQDSLLTCSTARFNTKIAGLGNESLIINFYFLIEYDRELANKNIYTLKIADLRYNVAASEGHQMAFYFDDSGSLIYVYQKADGYVCGERELYFNGLNCLLFISHPGEIDCIESGTTQYYADFSKKKDFSESDVNIIQSIRLLGQLIIQQFSTMSSVAGMVFE